jgi:IclR family pca regulon transcriptional regulator
VSRRTASARAAERPTEPSRTPAAAAAAPARAKPKKEAMNGLAKGLEVIRAFTRERPALTLTQVAEATALAPATARRCLLTLEELGYVVRHERSYLLRPRVLELGAAYLESMNVEAVTKNYLEELALATDDSAALAVLDGADIVYVARASVRTVMRLEAHVGTRLPAYCTSMGRVLLAGLTPARLDRYFESARLDRLTERTVVDPRKLRQLVDECRTKGYSAVEDELAYGVVAVAVPVHDQAGRVVAAVNSSGHSRRVHAAKLAKERLPLLREVSAKLTRELARGPGLALAAQL